MKIIQGSTIQQPWESRIYPIDCADSVPTGVTISSVAAAIFDSDGTDLSGSMIQGVPSISGSYVYVQIKAVADGENYNLRIRLTLSNGEKAEDDVTIYGRERS